MTQPSSNVSPQASLSPVLVAADPRDALGTAFAVAWLAWVVAFGVIEGIALHQDAKHDDRVKRTLSSNVRYVFATDSVTGVPVAAKLGKLRRLALITAEGWLTHHFARQGEV